MSIVFADRQSTYPNRYKITRDDGSEEYITLERADEPTVEGTPLNAATLNGAFQAVRDDAITYELSKSGSTISLIGSDGSETSVEGSEGDGTKVEQTSWDTNSYDHPVLFSGGNTNAPGTVVDSTYKTNKVTIQSSTGRLSAEILKSRKFHAPTANGGSNYGVGSAGQILTSNGSTVYWGDAPEGGGGGGAFTEDTTYPGCFYRMVNGEKEWLNPPMVYGMAYPTVERFNGRRVWVGVNDYGVVRNVGYGWGIQFDNLEDPGYEYPEEVFQNNCSVVYAYPYLSNDWDYHPYHHPSDPDFGGLITDAGSHREINFDPEQFKESVFEDYNFYCLYKFTNDMDEEAI